MIRPESEEKGATGSNQLTANGMVIHRYKKSEIKEQNGNAKFLKALCDALETYVKIYLEVACGRVKVILESFSWERPPIAAAAVCSGCLY